MAKTTSVIIGDHFAQFIERQVSEGRYVLTPRARRDLDEIWDCSAPSRQ